MGTGVAKKIVFDEKFSDLIDRSLESIVESCRKIDFDGYKQRLLDHRYDYRAVNRIMADVEECADLTLDEYLELCDIANGRDLQ